MPLNKGLYCTRGFTKPPELELNHPIFFFLDLNNKKAEKTWQLVDSPQSIHIYE